MAGLPGSPEESADGTGRQAGEAAASPAGQPAAPGSQAADSADRPAAEPPAPAFVLWMVLALASAFLCQGWLTGIPAFVLMTMARSDWVRGARDAGRGKMKLAKILTIAGVLVGLCLVGYLALAVALNESLPPPSY